MAEKRFIFRLFGEMRIETEGAELNLEMLLGKQLSNLFALFLCNHRQVMSKEMLIETIWRDSDNPGNAMKFAIHRLRNALKKIPELASEEWILTTKNGYQFNNDLNLILDYEEFEKGILKAKQEESLEEYQKSLDLYTDPFLSKMDSDWISLDRGYFQTMYFQVAELLSKQYLVLGMLKESIEVSKRALGFDALNEELIYNYLKALIDGRQYNAALSYYEEISQRFYKEMGVELQLKTRALFNIISSREQHEKRTSVEEFSTQLFEKKSMFGPMYCDYAIFKSIAQFEIRDCIRNYREKYVLFLDINGNPELLGNAMAQLLQLISISLRISDVYTRISTTQVAILLNLRQESDAYLVMDRIIARFYKILSSREVQILYKVKNLTHDHVFPETGKREK